MAELVVRASKIKMEHIKLWLAGMIEEEEEGMEGAGDRWCLFVTLIRTIWEQRYMPQQMQWVTILN